jgi:hypothetical protein
MSKAHHTQDKGGNRIGAMFFCPACNEHHGITYKVGWTFNGDLDNPTISPSIKVTHSPGDPELPGVICHSFVRNGRIEYCSDSTHALAGQTVELPDMDDC